MTPVAVAFALISLACVIGGPILARKGWKEGIRERHMFAFHTENRGRDAVIAGIICLVWGAMILAGGLVGLAAWIRQEWLSGAW